jgi:hypothetical protein
LLTTLVPDDAGVAGLLTLMLLIDARRSTRMSNGIAVLLADQDRTEWNSATIARGLAELARAHSFRSAGMFQFQAAVAALHATAPSFQATDCAGIVRLYDVMQRSGRVPRGPRPPRGEPGGLPSGDCAVGQRGRTRTPPSAHQFADLNSGETCIRKRLRQRPGR